MDTLFGAVVASHCIGALAICGWMVQADAQPAELKVTREVKYDVKVQPLRLNHREFLRIGGERATALVYVVPDKRLPDTEARSMAGHIERVARWIDGGGGSAPKEAALFRKFRKALEKQTGKKVDLILKYSNRPGAARELRQKGFKTKPGGEVVIAGETYRFTQFYRMRAPRTAKLGRSFARVHLVGKPRMTTSHPFAAQLPSALAVVPAHRRRRGADERARKVAGGATVSILQGPGVGRAQADPGRPLASALHPERQRPAADLLPPGGREAHVQEDHRGQMVRESHPRERRHHSGCREAQVRHRRTTVKEAS